MPRVSATQVKVIIETTLADSVVEACIDTATVIVDDIAAADATVSSERLTLLEKWLAAHFVAIREPRTQSEGVAGGGNESFQTFKTDLGLASTQYGQQAIALDPTGILAKAGEKKPRWLFKVD
jgi:hypothetical protein